MKLTDGKLAAGDLSLSGKNIFLEYPAGVKTTSSLELKLRSREGRAVLEGQIEIQEGYYEATLESFGSKGGNTRSWSHPSDATAGGIALDVGIVTKRPVEMDNNLGRLAAAANLRLAGTADRPRLTGALELEPDGRIYFGDRTYYIERGGVRFLDAAEDHAGPEHRRLHKGAATTPCTCASRANSRRSRRLSRRIHRCPETTLSPSC